MPKPRVVTKDGRCPYCGADFMDTTEEGTWLFWNARSYGTGYLEADAETGEVVYSGKTSSVSGERVTGYECGSCEKPLRLRAGTEEEWS